jgi:hypothetical protein
VTARAGRTHPLGSNLGHYALGRRLLQAITTIVTPDTLLTSTNRRP